MAWAAPTLISLWPDATEKEAREWWEANRRAHNDFANRFNRDWLNRLTGNSIDIMPSYDEIIAKGRAEGEL